VAFGRTVSGALVGWPVDSSGAPVDKRVVMTRTSGGTLIGWPLAGVGEAPDKRLLLGRTQDGTLIGWALLKTSAGGGCPDLSGYNPVDRSWSFVGTMTAGEGSIYRYDSSGSDPDVPSGKGWCISDLFIKLTRLSAGSGEAYVNIIMDVEQSILHHIGGEVDMLIPGMVSIEGPSQLDITVETSNLSSDNFHVEVGWTATEFDWPVPYP
jgi:hypothetical protein